jgi:hypothetical protein
MDTSDSRTTDAGAQGGFAGAPSWTAIAAWGGGLIQLALGAGLITAEGDPAIRVAGILLAVIGAVAIGWGAATLARGRTVVPRLGVAGSLAGICMTAVALSLDPARVSVVAVAVTVVLLVAVALGCALGLRRATRRDLSLRGPQAARPHLLGLIVGAVVVAGLVTPALAATEAGQHAVPHGEMVEPGHH